jgi:TPR repeat protein
MLRKVCLCPFCNSNRSSKTVEENNEELMKRVEANDAGAMCLMAQFYDHGEEGLQQDRAKAMELYTRAAGLGCGKAHSHLGFNYHAGGDSKKAKFHYETAAMLGDEVARYSTGAMELMAGNMERAINHYKIAASSGHFHAMHELITCFGQGHVSRESIESTLTAYNNSCFEMRSGARDAYIRMKQETLT